MTEVTEDMILDYLVKKGGVVRNVDLVRHFRKHLQNESSTEKDRARVIFKERVNKVAFIKAEKQDKYLHIRPEYVPAAGLTRPPTGRMSSSSNRSSLASLGSLDEVLAAASSGHRWDSSTDHNFGARSPPISMEPPDHSSQPPAIATTSSRATPPSVTSPSSSATPPLLSKGTNDDFGSTLMAELDSFGSLLDSMGYKGSSSSGAKKTTPSSSSVGVCSSGSTSAPSTKPTSRSSSSYLASYEANSHLNTANSTTSSSYNSYAPSSDTSSSSTSQAPPTSTTNYTPSPVVDTSASVTPSGDQSSTTSAGSGVGKAVGISTLTKFTPSKSHMNTSPSHSNKPASRRRGQSSNTDMDLMSVLSSLPSANQSSFGKKPPSGAGKPPSGAGKPPSGMGRTAVNAGKPPSGPPQPAPGISSGPSYQNSTDPQNSHQSSTRFPQPSAQTNYQNSTKFSQPPLPNQQQTSYQNSTRFSQPPLPNQQQTSYQNSTKFIQPPLPNQQQTSYQNSTRFSQPPLPNQQQASYQNSTRFAQPSLPQPQQPQQPPIQSAQQSSQMAPQQQPVAKTTGFNPLAALSRNVPQATNPAPLPPADPSYSSRSNLPRLSALLSTDVTQMPTETPPPASESPPRKSPDPQPKANPANMPPPAPVRTSSISKSTSGRGKSSSTNILDNRATGKEHTASPPSTSPSHSLPRRVAPPPPPAASNLSSKDSPGRTSNSSVGSTSSVQKANVTSSGNSPRSPTSISAPVAPSNIKTNSTSAGQTSTSYTPFSGSTSSGLGSMDLSDLAGSMFSSIGGSLSAQSSPSNSLTRSPKSSSPVQTSSLAVSSSLPSVAVAGSGGGASGLGHTSPGTHNLGPTVSIPPGGVVARSHLDAASRRNGSLDSTPSIRVESANEGSGSGTSSPSAGRSQSPAGSNGATIAPPETRGRTLSFQGVQMRNKPNRSGPGSAVRRSRNLDNKDALARLSVSMTPPSVRKAQQAAPPDVAPKPLRRPSPSPARSGEDVRYMDNEDVDEYDHDQEYDYIDPLEKEWILAAVQAELDTQQRLLATDSTLLNRKGFLHGYAGLHWAAKHGRMDILSMLLEKGALVDIKSNGGLTPLHVAAQSGHEHVIYKLVVEHNANISLREHGGRRPIDMLNNKVSVETKKLLSKLRNHGFPIRIEMTNRLCTFTQARDTNANQERLFAAVAEVVVPVAPVEKDKVVKRKPSPRSSIRKSFSFKTKNRVRDQISPPKMTGKEKK